MKLPFFLAKRFVAGERLVDGLLTTKEYHAKNIKVTLDHLGEDITTEKKANHATKTYIRALEKLPKHTDTNISVKLSQLGLAIDEKIAYKNIKIIIETAKKLGRTVEIDMEGSKYTQKTLNVYYKLLKQQKKIVLAVQAYLFRTKEDIREIKKKGGSIRLVKGGYKEPQAIAFKEKKNVDKNYVQLMEYFLRNGKFIAIATHDGKIINHAKKFIKKHNINKKHFEFEMLYGIRKRLQESLAEQNYAIRVYVPYGTEWFPYYYRRLRERKENLFFALEQIVRR